MHKYPKMHVIKKLSALLLLIMQLSFDLDSDVLCEQDVCGRGEKQPLL